MRMKGKKIFICKDKKNHFDSRWMDNSVSRLFYNTRLVFCCICAENGDDDFENGVWSEKLDSLSFSIRLHEKRTINAKKYD